MLSANNHTKIADIIYIVGRIDSLLIGGNCQKIIKLFEIPCGENGIEKEIRYAEIQQTNGFTSSNYGTRCYNIFNLSNRVRAFNKRFI